jgi:Rad3-related DNA helicase
MISMHITKSEADLLCEAIAYFAREIQHLDWKVCEQGEMRVTEEEIHKLIDAINEYQNNVFAKKSVLEGLRDKLLNYI